MSCVHRGGSVVGHAARVAMRPFAPAAHWVLHNRLAIGLASFVWLAVRSGTQPRRLAYPCQRVAAANVSVLALGLIPALLLWRRRARAALVGAGVKRQFGLAAVMCVLAFLAVEGVQFADDSVPPTAPVGPMLTDAATPTVVGICRDPNGTLTMEKVETMVRSAVASAGGLAGVVQAGDWVVIKPNLVQDYWQRGEGVTTDPWVVAAVVKLAKEAGASKVTIAEGTAATKFGSHTGRDITWYAFHDSGYDSDMDGSFDYDTSVDLFDLNDTGGTDQIDPNKVTDVEIPNGILRTHYYVPNILLNCDVLISVPTLKNHYNGSVTLALKNRVGTAPNDIYHSSTFGLDQQMKWNLVHSVTMGFPGDVGPTPTTENQCVRRSIVDLNLVRPQDYAIIDGLVGVTNGPADYPVQTPSTLRRMIIAGPDSVAVDTVGTLTMGYDPQHIDMIVYADGTGVLGTMDTSIITVKGDHVASVRYDFPAPYHDAVRVESTPPSITGMSISDGAKLWGPVLVKGTGVSDNRAVVKAELYVDGAFVATNPTSPYADFVWDSTSVADGSHEVKVTVYDAALNEQSLTRNVTVANDPAALGDFDYDGDVDVSDFGIFQICFNGPSRPPTLAGCVVSDFDRDGDVDLSDFSVFLSCFNGPSRPPGAGCPG